MGSGMCVCLCVVSDSAVSVLQESINVIVPVFYLRTGSPRDKQELRLE